MINISHCCDVFLDARAISERKRAHPPTDTHGPTLIIAYLPVIQGDTLCLYAANVARSPLYTYRVIKNSLCS